MLKSNDLNELIKTLFQNCPFTEIWKYENAIQSEWIVHTETASKDDLVRHVCKLNVLLFFLQTFYNGDFATKYMRELMI